MFANQDLTIYLLLLLAAVVAALAAGTLLAVEFLASGTSRQRLSRVLTPKVTCVGVLCISLLASRYLAAHVLQSLKQTSNGQSLDLEDVPVLSTQALTDKGRAIGLFHFKMHSTPDEMAQFIGAEQKALDQFIRLTEPDSTANCHGWVFTGGKYGIRDPDVAGILADNDYAEVTEPREGDLAIYFKGEQISHAGLVRLADKKSPILVESKWGPFGVYLHPVEKHPWPGPCKFYRSPRSGHLLVVQPGVTQAVSMRPVIVE